jgi:hypothetical protein
MSQEPQTFPTLRRWRGMSENEQDALLDGIEQRRRRRALGLRAMVAFLCAAALAVGAALIIAH